MKIFTNREIKALCISLSVVCLFFIISGQIVVKLAADNYKQNMILHDYGIAGHLAQYELDESQIAQAFTSSKKVEDVERGRILLQAVGYDDNIRDNLLPVISDFHRRNMAALLILFIVFCAMVCAILLFFIIRHYKIIEKAELDIRNFMDGNITICLDDQKEGNLSKLFASINAMATSQASHIEKEKKDREFLKDTISHISHQIKTPLSALKMYIEIIQNENTHNNIVDKFISKSEREIERMEALIQKLLKLAKLDAGAIRLERKLHNVKEFLEDVINTFRARADMESKKILLHCDEHITLNFDEEWLFEALSNIIKNSLDHTNEKNQIEIICDETPVLIKITIRDNGVGIHPEDIHHVFTRFYRSRFSKDKQGVGIGLALSKAITEEHRGIVTVESEFGKGAAFHLVFPKLANL